MRERVRVVAICEDKLQRSFLIRLFARLRIDPVRWAVAPSGEGSAEQWVRKQLLEEAKAHRSQAKHQTNLSLVVMTDGDKLGVAERQGSLDKALTDAEHVARQGTERIAYLIPTWSIETWLAWLCGFSEQLGGIDETIQYKKHGALRTLIEAEVVSPKLAVAVWVPPLPKEEIAVPSLATARRELVRIQ
jgi:hypothetical protein